MAESATDILSIEDARIQLQLDDDIPESRILPVIQDATAYVQRKTGIPLLDRTQVYNVNYFGDKEPIIIPTRDLKNVVSITYWNTDQEMREEPEGSIEDLSTLGRTYQGKIRNSSNRRCHSVIHSYTLSSRRGYYGDTLGYGFLGEKSYPVEDRVSLGFETEIWPPEDGWPDRLAGSFMIVSARIGFDITPETNDIRRAVILLARHFYEAPERIESDFAIMALIEPLVRHGEIV